MITYLIIHIICVVLSLLITAKCEQRILLIDLLLSIVFGSMHVICIIFLIANKSEDIVIWRKK